MKTDLGIREGGAALLAVPETLPVDGPVVPALPAVHPHAAQSRLGLHALTYFWSSGLGVVGPFLSTLLADRGWAYGAIGIALACIGIGVSLLQTPAGMIADRTHHHRWLLALMISVVGLGYALLPHLSANPWTIIPLLLLIGVAQAFYFPLQASVTMALAGRANFSRMVGTVHACNHLGNITSALVAMVAVGWAGAQAPFTFIGITCTLAAVTALLIRLPERHPARTDLSAGESQSFWQLCQDQRVLTLAIVIMLYSVANGPMLALAGLYVRHLHGSETQVASLVLAAQLVMIPVSLSVGRVCDVWGRKPLFVLATMILASRIALYALTRDPQHVVAIEMLDGAASGIFGVTAISIVADLTRDRGNFSALNGFIATAGSIGGVFGPILTGALLQQLGFTWTFAIMAGMALLTGLLFFLRMPETHERTHEWPATEISPR